jgi:hypothetical protein
MKIETEDYQIAHLSDQSQIEQIIQAAESRLAKLTGSPITLIAYAKKENDEK